MKWLEKKLVGAQGLKNILVFFHVPLFDPRGMDFNHCLPADSSESLTNLFRKYNVKRVFSGHVHGYFEREWKGVPYTISGGGGGELVGTDPTHYFFHYLKVRITGDSMDIQVEKVPFSAYDRIGRFWYMAWLHVSSFIRFHGIEFFLILSALLIAISIVKAERNAKNPHLKGGTL